MANNDNVSEKLRGYLEKADTLITVDTRMIEKSKPFRIVKRESWKNKDGVVVNLYIITLPDIDPRWMAKSPDAFELFFIPGTTECVAKIPTFDYSFLHDPEAEEAPKIKKKVDQGDMDAINITRNQVLAETNRHWQYYRLNFPEFLDNSVFSPDSKDGEVKPKMHSVVGKWKSTKNGQTTVHSTIRMHVEWKIAVHENQKRHTSAYKPKKSDLMQEAEEEFGSMSLDD